jgi:acetyl esterase/lipase
MKKLVILVALALVAGAVPALAGPPRTPPGRTKTPPGLAKKGCSDSDEGVKDLSLAVDGGTATGRYALPSQAPDTLVVFAHGYGHDSRSWIEHMQRAAGEHGVVAVAMDYRGTYEQKNDDGSTTIRGWFVKEGAADMVAATQHLRKLCPSVQETVLFGVSMGGNASGLALAEAANEQGPDGKPLFDYWFDVEGAVNAVETYAGAAVLAPANEFAANAKADIEDELNATPEQDPQAYVDLAVVSHMDEIGASGVKGVVVIHALEDGLVPYNQAREIVPELVSQNIPTEVYTIGTKGDGESGTTISGYSPVKDSPFAGHASEKSTTHMVMVVALERLWSLVDQNEEVVVYEETFIDGVQ